MILQCFCCHRAPDEIEEYQEIAVEQGMTPSEYVLAEEGTLNQDNGHFCCTECYIAIGMPSTRATWKGWKAP